MNALRVPSLLLAAAILAISSQATAGWMEVESGTSQTLHAVHFPHFPDTDHGYGVGASGTGIRTTDGGATWTSMDMGTAVDLHDVYFTEDVGVAVGDAGTIVRTTDSGATWTPVSSGVSVGLRSVALSFTGGVAGGLSQTILYTTDAGASWSIAQSDFFGGGFFGASMLSSDYAFVAGQNSIFQPLAGRSTDGGATWDFDAFYLNSNEGAVARIEFTDVDRGHAVSHVWDGRGAISRTTDSGVSWTTEIFPNDLHGISFPISGASQVGYVVGSLGTILMTSDAGVTWHPQDSGTAATLHDVHFMDFDRGVAVGAGGIVLRTDDGGVPSSVDGLPELEVTRVRVAPNPFQGSTEFRFAVPRTGTVTLEIFDVVGRKVRTLGIEEASGSAANPEESVLSWDGTDDGGRLLGSGVYTYQLSTPGGLESGNLVLVR